MATDDLTPNSSKLTRRNALAALGAGAVMVPALAAATPLRTADHLDAALFALERERLVALEADRRISDVCEAAHRQLPEWCKAHEAAHPQIPEWCSKASVVKNAKAAAERERVNLPELEERLWAATIRVCEIEDRIRETPAHTVEGIALKLRQGLREAEYEDIPDEPSWATELFMSILKDVERLAG